MSDAGLPMPTNGRFKDMTGMTFGRLKVVSFAGCASSNQAKWRCLCDCGQMSTTLGTSLRSGRTTSCGCLRAEGVARYARKHGMAGTRAHVIWKHMRQRTRDPSHKNYADYGGRGITLCDRWDDFQNFYDDMGDPPAGATIERIDNERGYEPGNCRWATRAEQCRNQRSNIWIEHNGERRILADWAALSGVKYMTLYGRIKRGMAAREAIETPAAKTGRHGNGRAV